jgi:hypothetical protein
MLGKIGVHDGCFVKKRCHERVSRRACVQNINKLLRHLINVFNHVVNILANNTQKQYKPFDCHWFRDWNRELEQELEQ